MNARAWVLAAGLDRPEDGRTLGLKVPQAVLLRADEVIQ